MKAPIITYLFIGISVLLFVIPFFWFTPEAMDIGGDSNRLYFYDPISFIKSVSLYSVENIGRGRVEPSYFYLVYVGFLALLKFFVHSPNILISILNGLKLSVGFLSIYFISKELIHGAGERYKQIFSVEISAIIAGIFYILALASENYIIFWGTAVTSHNQIFLNPLMFYLLLRYCLTKNIRYILASLMVSFIFSPNFSYTSAPPFFAFYPLAFLFLVLYLRFIRKVKIPFKNLFLAVLLFIGLQSFHVIPQLYALFDRGSEANARFSAEDIKVEVNYFLAVLGFGKASLSFLVPPSITSLRWVAFIAPIAIVLGYILNKRKNYEILLTSIFFYITFFLVSANITHTGIEIYKKLFDIPGFSMFRNFYAQWAYIYMFFYALLIGQSLFVIFIKLKNKVATLTGMSILVILCLGYWPFLSGKLVNRIHWGSEGVETAWVMDPRYEETLQFIRTLPDEGKILMLPLTDYYFQVLYGLNNGAYVGPTSISSLTSKNSFTGYQHFYPDPIPEAIRRYSREGDYAALLQIFSLFNIRYIFHNTDPRIYEEKFPNFPNSYMMNSLPKTQKEYKEFVQKFPVRLRYGNGPYEIYELDENEYRSEVYIPDSLYTEDMLTGVSDKKISFQSAFLEKETCQQNEIIRAFCDGAYMPPDTEIEAKKINPTKYILTIKQSVGTAPFLLIFQNNYHKDWKLSIDRNPPLSEKNHVLVNKYANAWIITNEDRKGKSDYSISLDLVTQRYFWYGLWTTGISLCIFIILVIRSFVLNKNSEKH